MLLHSIVTLVLSVMAGLGVGSGGLYLIWLREGVGLSQETAVAANLLFFIVALLSAAALHLRRGRIDGGFLARVTLVGIPFALLGQLLARHLPALLLRGILGVFLIFSGVFSLIIQKKQRKNEKSSAPALDKSANKDYNK